MVDVLLARYADCIFWLARYVERAENLARILDVNETFSRDSRGGQNWRSIIQLNSDEERFFASRHARSRRRACCAFYVVDADNPTSIVSAIAQRARERAHPAAADLDRDVGRSSTSSTTASPRSGTPIWRPAGWPALFATIKEACQTHTGITEGTFFRDQGWYFYQLGRYIERADQTTRLLDIKYHLLLPDIADVGSPTDVSQWNALAALGRRLSRLSPAARGQHDAGAGRRVPVVQPGLSALGPSLRARDRAAAWARSSRAIRCAAATTPPRSSTACAPFSAR